MLIMITKVNYCTDYKCKIANCGYSCNLQIVSRNENLICLDKLVFTSVNIFLEANIMLKTKSRVTLDALPC